MCGASAGELIVPLYIGKVIDLMEEGDYDTVGELSGYMIIAIVVSIYFSNYINVWLTIVLVLN